MFSPTSDRHQEPYFVSIDMLNDLIMRKADCPCEVILEKDRGMVPC